MKYYKFYLIYKNVDKLYNISRHKLYIFTQLSWLLLYFNKITARCQLYSDRENPKPILQGVDSIRTDQQCILAAQSVCITGSCTVCQKRVQPIRYDRIALRESLKNQKNRQTIPVVRRSRQRGQINHREY